MIPWGCPLTHPQNEPGWLRVRFGSSPSETIGLTTEVNRSGCWSCCTVAVRERRVGATPRSGAVPSERRAFRAASREREGRERPPHTGVRRPGRDRRDLPRDRPRHCGCGAPHQQPSRVERARRQIAQASTTTGSTSRASCPTAQRPHPHHGPAHARHHPPVRGCLQRSRDRSAVRWFL